MSKKSNRFPPEVRQRAVRMVLDHRGEYLCTQEPKDETWLWREARLADPPGNVICLYFAGDNSRNLSRRVAS